uniref:Uncharacterized protein n=1 Tax=Peronospora matthiolae TaxID=2874970 RepID=A0AAV1T1G1_9STRA
MGLPDQRGLKLRERIKACIVRFWALGHIVVDLLDPDPCSKLIKRKTLGLGEVVKTLHLFTEDQSKTTQVED